MANSTDILAAPTLGTVQGTSSPPDSQSEPSRRCAIRDANGARIIVVMGVSGTGKSTLGAALSKTLHVPFIDGDHLHSAANVAKMSRGEPLGDDDRWPWLETVRKTAVARMVAPGGGEERVDGSPCDCDARRPGVIVACSALKKTYRAVLRGEGGLESESTVAPYTYFVFLKGDRDVLMARMQDREGHFMKVGMLESQLDALESPEGEPGVVSVSMSMSTEEQVQRVVTLLRLLPSSYII